MSISSNIRIYAAQDYAAMCRRGANILFAELIRNPHALLGLATGSSPIGIYDCLADWCNKGDISFRHCRTVNLDEYCGLSADHPQSYAYFMRKNLFDRVDICLENTHLPDGINPDAAAECARYDALLEEMGEMDVQLLGIGENGHIGFNEPSDHFTAGTNQVELTESTVNANARFFENVSEVPTHAYTMGIRSIMQAKKILLVASGKKKAAILERALFGPITPSVPASVLQLARDVHICADEEALEVIRREHPDCVFC